VAVHAVETVAIGWRAGFVVMLAQAGSPTRSRSETVGIFQTAVTSHTRDGIDAVLGVARTAEVDHPAGCSRTAMTVVTGGLDIRISQVNVVEIGSPIESLGGRYVRGALVEGGVALGALPHSADRV